MVNDQITCNLVVARPNHDTHDTVRVALPPDFQILIMVNTLIHHNRIDLVVIARLAFRQLTNQLTAVHTKSMANQITIAVSSRDR